MSEIGPLSTQPTRALFELPVSPRRYGAEPTGQKLGWLSKMDSFLPPVSTSELPMAVGRHLVRLRAHCSPAGPHEPALDLVRSLLLPLLLSPFASCRPTRSLPAVRTQMGGAPGGVLQVPHAHAGRRRPLSAAASARCTRGVEGGFSVRLGAAVGRLSWPLCCMPGGASGIDSVVRAEMRVAVCVGCEVGAIVPVAAVWQGVLRLAAH